MTAPLLPQLGIAALGVTAIFLTQSRHENVRRWACVLGLCAQPFWIWSSVAAGQYGILLMCAFYGAAWGKGVWVHWIKPEKTS